MGEVNNPEPYMNSAVCWVKVERLMNAIKKSVTSWGQ